MNKSRYDLLRGWHLAESYWWPVCNVTPRIPGAGKEVCRSAWRRRWRQARGIVVAPGGDVTFGRLVLEERLQFAEGFFDHIEWGSPLLDGFSHFPIQTLDLIRRRDASMTGRFPGFMIQTCRDYSMRLYWSHA